MPATRLPSIQFYPADWLKDPALRSVSVGARGLWMDMLCLMSESDPRGYLQDATGSPLGHLQVARMTGCPVQSVRKLMEELEVSGVFSKTEPRGVIYSRRMVRDEQIREQNRANGRKGGNPSLMRSDNPPDKRPDNRTSNRKPTPSSSSSSSSSDEGDISHAGEGRIEAGGDRPTFLTGHSAEFLEWWEAYPRKTGIEDAWAAYQAAVLVITERKAVSSETAHQLLIMATDDYANSPAGKAAPGPEDFRPKPANWLKGGHYDDDRSEWAKPNGARPVKKPGKSMTFENLKEFVEATGGAR